MAQQSSLHATAVQLAASALRAGFGIGWQVRVRAPLALAEDFQPVPDLAVIAGEAREFRDAHPGSAALAVEIADAGSDLDRYGSQRAYAAAGVPELWRLELGSRTLEVFHDPGEDGYREHREVTGFEAVSPLALSGIVVHVEDLLP